MMFFGEKYNELADPSLGTATLVNEQWLHDLCTTLSLYFFTPPSVMTSTFIFFSASFLATCAVLTSIPQVCYPITTMCVTKCTPNSTPKKKT
jgi:hypothetical protein